MEGNMEIALNTDEAIKDILNEIEEDFDTDKATYEVWALGYDCEGEFTGTDLLLGTFEDPDAAAQYASIITWYEIRNLDGHDKFIKTSDMLSIEVETVVDDGEGGTMNVGTIFSKAICVCVEDIRLSSEDFEIVEEDKIKVSCEILKDFNKNDKVKIYFTDGEMIFNYKIVSRVVYTDGEYYHLEFLY
jgi:hypothetical protein